MDRAKWYNLRMGKIVIGMDSDFIIDVFRVIGVEEEVGRRVRIACLPVDRSGYQREIAAFEDIDKLTFVPYSSVVERLNKTERSGFLFVHKDVNNSLSVKSHIDGRVMFRQGAIAKKFDDEQIALIKRPNLTFVFLHGICIMVERLIWREE